MANEFSVLAPEQEKELKNTFIVMINMQHYSQKNKTKKNFMILHM